MFSTIITSVLNVVSLVLPLVTDSKKVAGVVEALNNIVPVIVKEAQDVAPMVRNIIEALRGNPATTAEQLSQLDALDAQVDQAFDAAAAKATAEDAQPPQDDPPAPDAQPQPEPPKTT